MTAQIIDGKAYAEGLRGRIAGHVARLKARARHHAGAGRGDRRARSRQPDLCAPARPSRPSKSACTRKSTSCPRTTPEAEVLALVEQLNADPKIHGILVQLPLPKQIDPNKVIATISPDKDVDCFTPASVGKLQIGLPGPVSLHAARLPDAAARFRRRPRGQARGDRRPLQPRRQADGAAAAARELHRDGRPFAHRAICRASCGRPISWSPPSAGR